MRKDEWFARFEDSLRPLPTAEKTRAIEYYRELCSDKAEAGMPEEEIVASFGLPEAAAREILDNYNDTEKDGDPFADRADNANGSQSGYQGSYQNGYQDGYQNSYQNAYRNAGTYGNGGQNTAKRGVDGKKIAALLLAVLVAGALGYCAFAAAAVLFGLEAALMVGGIVCLFTLRTLAVGLILLGVFIGLLCPFIHLIVWAVKGIIALTKKVYGEVLGGSKTI